MIDFRYHLVSLISVFLALAVGIVLGAGPLREGIGDTLTGQVEQLRADRDQLRADLEERTVDSNDRDAYIIALTDQVSEDTLAGKAVAVVALPGAEDDDVAAVTDTIVGAGADLSTQVRFTDAWVNADASFLQTFAQQIAGYLAPPAAADARPEEVLASAIAQTVATWGATGDETPAVLLELLAGGDQPFVTLSAEPTQAAGSVVVVGPRPTPAPDPEAAAETATIDPTVAVVDWTRVVSAIAGVAPAVTVGASEELILSIRQAAVPTTTIDSIGEVPAAVTVPLAVVAELTGVHGRYGFAASAQAPVPTLVELTAPAEPVPADGTSGEPTATPTEGTGG